MRAFGTAVVSAILILAVASGASADYLEVHRPATLKSAPHAAGTVLLRPDVGAFLVLLEDQQTNGYYRARPATGGAAGWIYRTLVRRLPGTAPGTVTPADDDPVAPVTGEPSVSICSFNIQFLGLSTRRKATDLASAVDTCDVVVVQELVAPPYAGLFPDRTPFKPDAEAAAFFDAMRARGYEYQLSEEDTGPGAKNHINSSATEWWVTFYRAGRVLPATDLPRGFLAADRTQHPDFDRVPHAFAYRTIDRRLDFVVVSVHLRPGTTAADVARRKHELGAIRGWIASRGGSEGDFFVLGDMNFKDCDEIGTGIPAAMVSLNLECLATNTNVNGPRPYDNVLYDDTLSPEVDAPFGFVVVDLIGAMASLWDAGDGGYPGTPYDHNRFRAFFSDHHPVAFRLTIPDADDDPPSP